MRMGPSASMGSISPGNLDDGRDTPKGGRGCPEVGHGLS
jgi:hypothetical protein